MRFGLRSIVSNELTDNETATEAVSLITTVREGKSGHDVRRDRFLFAERNKSSPDVSESSFDSRRIT